MAILNADAPLIYRQTVWKPFVAGTRHREPRIRKAPAKRRILLAVVHMAVHPLPVDLLDVFAEEFSDVFIGGPVHWHTKLVPVALFELLFQFRPLEPVGTKPVEVGELLDRQLVDLAIRTGGERDTNEVVQVECRECVVLGLTLDHVADGHGLAITEVRADQVRVVDVAVVDIFARLHLCLQLLDDIALLHQVVPQLDACNFTERTGQGLGLVFVRGDGLRCDVDFHAAERLGRFDEPAQLFHLLLRR